MPRVPVSSARVRRARRASALARSRQPDDPELIAAVRDHLSAIADEHIAELVAKAPPLSEAQRARLRGLLAEPEPEPAAS